MIFVDIQVNIASLSQGSVHFKSAYVRSCPLMSAKDIPPKIFLLRRFDLVAFKSAFVRLCPLTNLRNLPLYDFLIKGDSPLIFGHTTISKLNILFSRGRNESKLIFEEI